MKTINHLTKKQLSGYTAHSLENDERTAVGRHLLDCADCRSLLSAPSAEQFRAALMIEKQDEEIYETVKFSLPASIFSKSFQFLQYRQALIWSAGAVILAAGFSLLIWLGDAGMSNREVVRANEPQNTSNNAIKDEKINGLIDKTVSTNKERENQPQQPNKMKQADKTISPLSQNMRKPELTEERELAELFEKTPPTVLSLRPNDKTILRGQENYSPEFTKTFGLLAPIGETVLEPTPEFLWEKIENVRSYRISIFDADFNEILTAEVSENKFKPDKPLKRGAKYLWRVAAVMNDREIIAPLPPQPPAVFRVAGGKTESRIEYLKKAKRDEFKLAVFYAQEGMLDSARCVLIDILRKNPKRRAAHRLLAKVDQWRVENQTTVQRCGIETTSNKNW